MSCPTPAALVPIPAATLNLVAQRGYYTIDVNPRQLLVNNIGITGVFFGGGSIFAGSSAKDLDDVLSALAEYAIGQPHASSGGPTVALDVGASFSAKWVPATVADVQNLRAAFFALYGLGKPNWYGPQLTPPSAQ